MTADPIKEALHRLPYGFYSITSRNGNEVNAMVGNWLTQVSFEPRLLLFALSKIAYTHEVVSAGGVFAVNIFNKEDDAVIRQLTKARAKKPDKMAGVAWTPGPATGCPVLEGAAAVIECRAVSYTHLDVYKRQATNSSAASFRRRSPTQPWPRATTPG